MQDLVYRLGFKGITMFMTFYKALYFAYECVFKLFSKKSYNVASFDVLIKQVYFTSVQLLPLLFFIGIVFGAIFVALIVHYALDYALKDHIGEITISLLLNQFAPLMTVLLLALRSGAAINTEIAVMKVSKELNTLKAFNIDVIEYLFLPRIIAGVISTILLASFLSIIMFISGYLYLLIFFEVGLDLYIRALVHAVDMKDFIFFFIKTLLFGFVVILIPIYSGLQTRMSYSGISVSVLTGMVELLISIMSIEVILLIVRYL